MSVHTFFRSFSISLVFWALADYFLERFYSFLNHIFYHFWSNVGYPSCLSGFQFLYYYFYLRDTSGTFAFLLIVVPTKSSFCAANKSIKYFVICFECCWLVVISAIPSLLFNIVNWVIFAFPVAIFCSLSPNFSQALSLTSLHCI